MLTLLLALGAAGSATLSVAAPNGDGSPVPPQHTASGWLFYKFPTGQPGCAGVGINNQFFKRNDCGFAVFALSDTDGTEDVEVRFYESPEATQPFATTP